MSGKVMSLIFLFLGVASAMINTKIEGKLMKLLSN